MKKQLMNKSLRKSRQRGFTLIEILGVLALIGVIGGIAYSMFDTASKEDMARRVHDANILSQTIPTAIIEVHTLEGSLSACSKTDLTNAGAPPNNSLGNAWTVSSTAANQVVLSWSTAGASDPDAYGNGLVTALTTNMANPGMLGTNVPTYDATADALTITYDR